MSTTVETNQSTGKKEAKSVAKVDGIKAAAVESKVSAPAVEAEAPAPAVEAPAPAVEAPAPAVEAPAPAPAPAPAVEAPAPVAIRSDFVIASVQQRYSLNLGAIIVTHVPGIHKMPREEAEHEFAKIRGTVIVGVPEEGSLNDYHAQEQLNDAKVKAENLVLSITGLASHLSELTEEQKEVVQASLEAAKTAFEKLVSLK